uniref:Uncharacterized protein n=1 Tax=Anopheles coluzzii TaxID=1518534 RepID=A0A8W7PUL9_ANOCL
LLLNVRRHAVQPLPPVGRLLVRSHPRRHVPEADVGVLVLFQHQPETGPAAQLLVQRCRTRERIVHQRLQPGRTARFVHEPKLERIHLPAALHALVARVVRDVVEFVLLEEIVRLGGVALVQQTPLLDEEDRTLQRCAERFVRVPGEGLGTVGTGQQVFVSVGKHCRPTETRVYVQPDTVPLTNVRDTIEVVERTEHGCTGGGIDEERLPAGVEHRLDRLFELLRDHATAPVTFHLYEIVQSDPKPMYALRNAVMGL